MDDTTFGMNLDVPYMDDVDEPSGETCNSIEEFAAEQTNDVASEGSDPGCVSLNCDNDSASCPAFLLRILPIFTCCSGDYRSVTVPRSAAGNLEDEIEEFIPGVHQFYKNCTGTDLQTDTVELLRMLLLCWNRFLQGRHGIEHTFAIPSSDIKEDINEFILCLEEHRGGQFSEAIRKWIKQWLPRWNMFLQARAGETPMTSFNVLLTIVGFIFYIVDLGSDIATAIFFASNRQWWQAIVTLAIVYGAVIIHTAVKWQREEIHCTGAVDWLRYIASSLVNWPDVKLYGALCRLEWQLHTSSVEKARLVLEWQERRFYVAFLKLTEGVCEACPQAILQLYLLVPDLYGHWTWTDYLRIAGASVSLCTAGAALVNREKFTRILAHTDLALSELVVLHVWAVPVTVSRLLSLALVLSVHLYGALAGVALHLVLYGVYRCRTVGVPRALNNVITMCLGTLQFCMSPFAVDYSIKCRRVSHAIHFLVNTAMTVVWALGTPLVCAHPALYTAIICFNAVMFAVGLVGWQLYEKHWPDSY